MGGVFSFCTGGTRKDLINERDKAILELKTQSNKLQQYRKKVILVIDRETEIAKECARNNKKQQAILALKKRKFQEKLLEDTDQNLMNIKDMVSMIEQAQIQVKIAEQLKQGNEALKQLQKEMSLEEIENIIADTQEAIEYQNEISDALSGKFTAEEEDELMAELEEMERQNERLKYPAVPNNDLKINVNLDHVLPVKLSRPPLSSNNEQIEQNAQKEVEEEELVDVEEELEEEPIEKQPQKERQREPEMAI